MDKVWRSSITCLGLLLSWQIMVMAFTLPQYILPAPWDVFHTLYMNASVIGQAAVPTLIETLLGLLLGIFFGCLAGLTIAFFRPLSRWFLPILIISQAIPTFAIAPLLVIWLGYGMVSKIATTVLMIFFPITSSFYDGMRNTNQGWLDLAKTMNAKRWRTFWFIRIPAALPALASGIRVATVVAPIGAVVGEWVGSSQGLGYLMLNANARMEIDMMFAALIIIVVMALVLYFSVDKMLRRLIYWKSDSQ